MVLRTTNGGASWTIQTTNTSAWFTGISFANTSVGSLVGSYGVVYRTTDGGSGWKLTTAGIRVPLYGVRFTDQLNGTSVGYQGTILRTTDGGGTWNRQMSAVTGDLQGITFTDGNTAIAIGMYGALLRTTNAGAVWIDQTIKNSPVPPGATATVFWLSGISFSDPRTGIVVGKKDTLISTRDPGFRAFVCRTMNGGIGWTRVDLDYIRWLRAVSFADTNRVTAVGDSGFILQSTNAGNSWNEIPSGTIATLYCLSYGSALLGIVVGERGTILRTADGGSTWNARSSGTLNTLRGVWMADANTGVAVGDSMTVLRTTDGGLTWKPESGGSFSALNAVTVNGATRGYIVGEGGTILGPTPGLPVSVQDPPPPRVPVAFSLDQNYPNPFNPTTAISCRLAAVSYVTLRVYDVLGRDVATLVNEVRSPGQYTVRWNASGYSSGVYFYRLSVGPPADGMDNVFVQTKKLIILK